MSNVSELFRSLFIYSICLPLAVLLGYLMANPFDVATYGIVGFILLLLIFPLLMRWHHAFLLITWNTTAVLFFLPGRPQIWLALVWFSLLIGLGQYILNRKLKFLSAPTIARPLIILAVIVLITAKLTGGFGMRALGGDTYGGRRYVALITAILGFFALTSQRLPTNRAFLFVSLFFLGAITQVVGDMGAVVSRPFQFLFLLFPLTNLQGFTTEPVSGPGFISRLGGLSAASSAVFCLMLSRYGIREIFNWQRPGRLLTFSTFVILSLFGGYRSVVVFFLFTFAILFWMEGLMRSRLLPLFVLCIIFGGAVVTPFIDRLPLNVQRALSVLPVKVSPVAKASAADSTEWRIMMWKHVIPQIPEYLLLGKGYAIDARDLNMVKTTVARGGDAGTFGAELAGDYHNGPLSVIIPFGIFGSIAFVWFLVAGLRALYQNYHFGDPALLSINRFLFALFLAKIVFFFLIFGSLHSDLAQFTGLLGLSVCLNGGVVKPVPVPHTNPVFNRFKFQPGVRKAVGVS
jgi:hypothetical protein